MAPDGTPDLVADAPGVAFEVERFEWTAPDRLEVAGRWSGLRGHRFLRPTLDLEVSGKRKRMLAILEHKPWAAEEGEQWIAAFAVDRGAGRDRDRRADREPRPGRAAPAPGRLRGRSRCRGCRPGRRAAPGAATAHRSPRGRARGRAGGAGASRRGAGPGARDPLGDGARAAREGAHGAGIRTAARGRANAGARRDRRGGVACEQSARAAGCGAGRCHGRARSRRHRGGGGPGGARCRTDEARGGRDRTGCAGRVPGQGSAGAQRLDVTGASGRRRGPALRAVRRTRRAACRGCGAARSGRAAHRIRRAPHRTTEQPIAEPTEAAEPPDPPSPTRAPPYCRCPASGGRSRSASGRGRCGRRPLRRQARGSLGPCGPHGSSPWWP